ncbi:MAG: hypothetical protein PHP26_02910 [Syntrophomonas sp.]|uniref:hypothetical protein n=1 Tax=Syntrophomonas sp. TaxID=2053627 RepID=UPI00261C4C32|nr:hypothetical protein [Syntrophomonas sp.]MDD2510154.1 hypothetical protein [Syntrophomonas sp.]MDD3878926.1 hypothetical protein [Syntrophomonas sp.]MDD4625985.1 hypothetical protein [Syntrophomonas sp.]
MASYTVDSGHRDDREPALRRSRLISSGTYDEHRYIEYEERPGEFKKHDYVTGVHEVGSAAKDVENITLCGYQVFTSLFCFFILF